MTCKTFNSLTFILLITVNIFDNIQGLLKIYPVNNNFKERDKLLLTPYIKNGKFNEAKKLAAVNHEEMLGIESFSGYLTVNEQHNSNLFFWFFPSQIESQSAPVILWLPGDPGTSALSGLFLEIGAFRVGRNKVLEMREYNWNKNHNVLYIDSPVGTGYSFTDDEEGFSKNETQIYEDLYAGLVQFFKLFSELQGNDFYVTGESYAGKYVPGFSYEIHKKNPTAEIKINLKGLIIGSGYIDPVNQFNHSNYFYQTGLVDFHGRDEFREYEKKALGFFSENKYEDVLEIYNILFSRDSNPPCLFKNLTGLNLPLNLVRNEDINDELDSMTEWLQRPDTKRALHVGNNSFNEFSSKVKNNLKHEFMKSQANKLAAVLSQYKVLLYNGQLDTFTPYSLIPGVIINLQWSGVDDYKKAKRNLWRVDDELAGYIKVAHNLTEVLVRKAGHMVPADEPKWVLNLITQFTHHKTITYN
ncbi:venom serine carboxypeptidase-like [Microplitis mediator]|uniref:venom serine carboxypeptidase-like n=1 Tax=Microplitis mediator TaxID=375433 RepID=UPI00255397AC|nr:venom serine carboxypeptidase-like [Microplitis mediator]